MVARKRLVSDVSFDVPRRRLGKEDVNFYISADGEGFGRLSISKGAIVWFPKGSPIGRKMGWKKFDELMKKYAGGTESRK